MSKYSAIILSEEERELIALLRSCNETDVKSTAIELLGQFLQMDCSSRFQIIRIVMNIKDNYEQRQKITRAIEYGKRYSRQPAPKAQFGDLKIYTTK